jgi:hypothetical protein
VANPAAKHSFRLLIITLPWFSLLSDRGEAACDCRSANRPILKSGSAK